MNIIHSIITDLDLLNMTDIFQDCLDEMMNLLLEDPSYEEVEQLKSDFVSRGLTTNQMQRLIGKCTGADLKFPTQPDDVQDRETIIIKPDPKHEKMCCKIRLVDVLNEFGEAIYGKKFNEGVHGAFGVAQQVKKEVQGKNIVLRIPETFKGIKPGYKLDGAAARCSICATSAYSSTANRSYLLIEKMHNSIRHVEKNNVRVKIEYI